MKTFLQLVVVAALAWAFWVYGLPWVKRQAGQSRAPVANPAPGAGGSCVQLAARASDDLHDSVLDNNRALLDDGEWNGLVAEVDFALQQAHLSCDCRLESCATARGALSSLDGILASARGHTRSSQSIPLEWGRGLEQANQKLWEAYDLARDGR